jgi:uncharacterized surface protein with fasciclin (FAS1) repeats
MLRKATLADFATSDGTNLSTFADIFQSLGLEWVLKVPGPIQIFAPTNKAFDTFVSQDLNVSLGELLDSGSLIEKLLAFHIVLGNASSGTQATLLPGYTVSIDSETVIDGMGNTGNITEEVKAANGRVFVIDRVLLPAIDESPDD